MWVVTFDMYIYITLRKVMTNYRTNTLETILSSGSISLHLMQLCLFLNIRAHTFPRNVVSIKLFIKMLPPDFPGRSDVSRKTMYTKRAEHTVKNNRFFRECCVLGAVIWMYGGPPLFIFLSKNIVVNELSKNDDDNLW